MSAIVCFGSSSVYGVGGTVGGWPDYLKQLVHQRQYSDDGVGERNEVHNLGIPGETCEMLLQHIESDLKARVRPMQPKLIPVVRVGGNDAVAKHSPDNFVSTPDQFRENLSRIFTICKRYSEKILTVGFTPCDESKTCPKLAPRTGSKSYFFNERVTLFEETLVSTSLEHGVTCVPLFANASKLGWQDRQYVDGLHPNDLGYRWIAEQIYPVVDALLD